MFIIINILNEIVLINRCRVRDELANYRSTNINLFVNMTFDIYYIVIHKCAVKKGYVKVKMILYVNYRQNMGNVQNMDSGNGIRVNSSR